MSVNEYRVTYKTTDLEVESDIIFWNLYANKNFSFWLDSSKIINGYSRYSVMGIANNNDDTVVTYRSNSNAVSIIQNGTKTIINDNILDYLDEALRSNIILNKDERFPFSFLGGFIGYFGYELKSDLKQHTTHKSTIPDAAFLFITRYLVIDHLENKIYIVGLAKKEEEDAVSSWQVEVLHTLRNLQEIPLFDVSNAEKKLSFSISQDLTKYKESINSC